MLSDDVVSVPVRPVRIGFAGPLLMLAVRSRRASECGRKLGRRGECRGVGAHASGQSYGEFLEQPAVTVRIVERGERAVAAMLRVRTADAAPPKQVRLVRTSVNAIRVVEHFADLYAATDQLV